MARIVLTRASREDLLAILLYLRERSYRGARRVHVAIHGTFGFVASNPGVGERREDLGFGIRSFPVKRYRNYLVFYRAVAEGIQIIRVLHGARDLPGAFKE